MLAVRCATQKLAELQVFACIEAAGRLERHKRLANATHIVHTEDLHSLGRERQSCTDGGRSAIGITIANQPTKKALARGADQQRAT